MDCYPLNVYSTKQNKKKSKVLKIFIIMLLLRFIKFHFKVITCFMVAVWSRHYVGYALVALMLEWNSIFLHLRQLLQIYGVRKLNPWYRLNSLINLGMYSTASASEL